MQKYRSSLLSALLCLFLLCCAVQAVNLQITVRDSIDNTSLPHATVLVNGVEFAKTNNNGQVLYVHDATSTPLIGVTMDGYDDWEGSVARNQTALLVNLSRKALMLTVKLYDSDNLGPIGGATVNITALNSTQGKLTDAAGTAVFGVNASTIYALKVSAPNYQSHSRTVNVGNENQVEEIYLLSGNRYSFVVRDKATKVPISGAEIWLNAVLAGKTDERGILNTPVTRDSFYTIEIRKAGYDTYSESREISGSAAIYNAELTKAALGAFLYVYDENKKPVNGAEVYINETYSGKTNEFGRSDFPDLVFGSYPVEVRKDGFVSQSRTLDIRNRSSEYTFILAFDNADMTVYVQDKDQKIIPNATIFLDGTRSGQTDDHGQYLTKVKFNTAYNISAAKDGYQTAFASAQVIHGNTSGSTTLTLEKTTDWGLVGTLAVIAVIVIILFAAIRIFGRRPGRHIIRKNEI